jgi:hypothetical protein
MSKMIFKKNDHAIYLKLKSIYFPFYELQKKHTQITTFEEETSIPTSNIIMYIQKISKHYLLP